MFNPKEPKAGDVLSAALLLDFFKELQRLAKFEVVAPIVMENDESGIRLSLGLFTPIWIKLTSAGAGADAGKYAWARQTPTSGGSWEAAPDGRTGTLASDPAREVSGNDIVPMIPNPIVRAWRDPVSMTLLFQAGTC
jgi:hypothetical protein